MNEDLFFPLFVNVYISVLGKLVFDFFVIREICIYFCVIFEPTTFTGIIFHFFEDFRVLKRLVNYTKLDIKPAHAMSWRMEDRELTTATATWGA